jgi:hypothetical protein
MVALFIFIFLQVLGLSLEPHVSGGYVNFYLPLSLFCLIGAGITVAFDWKWGDVLGLETWHKALIVVIWVVFIASISFSGNQILPVPKASAENLQLSAQTEVITSAWIAPPLEDMAFLWLLPMSFMVAMGVILESRGFDLSKVQFTVLAFVAVLIASLGYNIWVLPGFTTAHIPAYGNNQVAYEGAFVFAVGQSTVYLVTGWFLPIAHGIHNFIVEQSKTGSYSVGGFNVI